MMVKEGVSGLVSRHKAQGRVIFFRLLGARGPEGNSGSYNGVRRGNREHTETCLQASKPRMWSVTSYCGDLLSSPPRPRKRRHTEASGERKYRFGLLPTSILYKLEEMAKVVDETPTQSTWSMAKLCKAVICSQEIAIHT